MPKRVGNIYNENLTFETLLLSHQKAKRNKRFKSEIILFEMDLEKNIFQLILELKNGEYKFGTYKSFTIHEPKERLIKTLSYKDRVVQMWYVENFIKPIFLNQFIEETYACIPKRGVHKSKEKMQYFMRKKKRANTNYWILKCDIKKFFFNINQEKLYNVIERKIKDKYFLKLTSEIIFNTEDKVEIPIGNYTSQYYANIYLNKLDRFVKDELKCKYYVRYMDDFILLLDNKDDCKAAMNSIEIFIDKYLNLKLNKKTDYFDNKQGVDFCGYRIYNTHVLVRNSNKIRNRRKFKKFHHKLTNDISNITYMRNSFMSVKGYIEHANSFGLYKYFVNIITKS
jgi:retron-type reverse transcriptase